MHQQTTPRAVFVMAAMAAASAALPSSAWGAAKAFSIAAGPLSPALSRFAGQSGVTFSSDPALTANMNTRGLQGSYDAAEGFARLLEGSGLEAVSPSSGVYVLRKLAAPAAEAAMPLVTVTGQLNSASTEGSGSYAGGPSKTAMRMELSVRDTPQSVTVITRAQLDDMGLVRLDDVLTQTTGIMVGQQDTERSSFYARGFEIGNVQVDGMPQGANSPLSDTILYDRIDVVRGANGLMGGTGDPSATINMVRKRPARGYQASAGLILGRWDSRRAELDVSAPLNAAGSVRGRAALAYQERDSHMTLYHERKTVGMAIVEADLGASTSLTAGVDFQHNRPTGATYGAVPYWNADGSLARLPRSFSLTTPWSTWANEQETFFTSLEQRFARGWKLHLGYARATSRINTTVAYGGSGYPDPATGQGMGLWSGVWGEGVSVNNNFDAYATGPLSLFGRRHTLIAGWNGSNQSSGSLGGNAAIAYPDRIPDYRHWTGNIPRPNFHPDGTHSDSVKRLAGAYLAGRFNVADPLNVIVGARVSNYRTETRGFDAAGKQTATSGYAETRDEITPYVGVVFDVSEQLSAYASYTTLFNPQTSKDRNNRFLDPESGTNAELGLKGEFFDGRLNASGALFRTLKKNLAEVDRTVPPGFLLPDGSMAYVANGDGVTARGVEFDVSGQPMPGLNVNAGLTLLKAEEASGKRAVTTQPRRLLRLIASYAMGGALQGFKVGGGVVAQSGIYSESWYGRPHAAPVEAPANVVQGGYALLNAMGSYEISKQLSAQLNISNLLDRKYYRNVGFYDGVYWGEPRNISLTLRAKF